MLEFKLHLTHSGFEFSGDDGAICKDFVTSYDDEELLRKAAAMAVFMYMEFEFEGNVDKFYQYLHTSKYSKDNSAAA